MRPTIAQLVELTEPYSYCPLECDGLTKVLTTLLQEQAIPHTVYSGTIAPSTIQSKGGIVHQWIEVETADEGRRTLDYRVRQWFGSRSEVPHGIFDPALFLFTYIGEPVDLVSLTRQQFLLMASPIVDLIACLEFLPRPFLFTVGYRQPYSGAILTFLTNRGFPLIDIRERAGSRFSPAYNKKRLEQRYPLYYYHVQSLGNINHNQQEAPIEFVDLQTGIEESRQIIYGDAAGQGAIYLCKCEDWQCCHRTKAARYLLETAPEIIAVHIQANGPLIIQQAHSRSELLMIGYEPIGPHGMFRVVFADGQIVSTYNPALVDRLVYQAQENPEGRQIDRSYCEVPLADLTRDNLEKQSFYHQRVVETTVSIEREEYSHERTERGNTVLDERSPDGD